MLFPTSEPLPSGPWHSAHFVRNVAVVAALSWAALARAVEMGKSVKPATTADRIAELQITDFRILSRNIIFSFLGLFNPGCQRALRTGYAKIS
jgi:hypothetical protein